MRAKTERIEIRTGTVTVTVCGELKCEICGRILNDLTQGVGHVSNQHQWKKIVNALKGEGTDGEYECQICGWTGGESDVTAHTMDHSNPKIMSFLLFGHPDAHVVFESDDD